MMKISSIAGERGNNFKLVRLVAAMAVLASHSYPLSGTPEPVRRLIGVSLGSIAVDCFFAVSGFLVTGSMLARRDVWRYFAARALRIYPALIVAVLLTALGLGAAFTILPLGEYYANAETWTFVRNNLIFFLSFDSKLPGVFAGTPYRYAVNESLWTLPFEAEMYLALGLIWLVLGIRKAVRLWWFQTIVLCIAAAGIARHLLPLGDHGSGRLPLLFFCGASYRVLSDRVTLSPLWFCSAFIAVGIALLSQPYSDKSLIVYGVALPYVLLYVSLVPAGSVRAFNRMGDVSYGVYLYAFPVQQAVAALIPGVSPLQMITVAAPATIVLAALSWHLIERPALNLKGVP
jgi:peptidoglycan/LPS O-acetylase OafA/YrhL